MFRSLEIENFRRFKRYELHELGRVNLLVGTNNSGKTSILEAVQMLVSDGDPQPLFEALTRRGERLYETETHQAVRNVRVLADVCRLFHGHTISPSSKLAVRGRSDRSHSFTANIEQRPQGNSALQQLLFEDEALESGSNGLGLSLRWSNGSSVFKFLPISKNGGIREAVENPFALLSPGEPGVGNVHFIESSSLSIDEVVRLFDAVALTAEEEQVIQSLQLVEPTIERIASVSEGGSSRDGRGGIVVRCRGQKQRVPIGSMGDGIWRMLGLILSLVRSEGGCLLVDEIDTGLHYTVLEDMWRLVAEVARRLDVQVFATTHSSDCWTSLAAVARDTEAEDVSIQRIEPDAEQAVAFSAEEMVLAAERGIEVR